MGLLSEMKLELITAPVVALYSPTRLLRLLATKRLLPRKSMPLGVLNPVMKLVLIAVPVVTSYSPTDALPCWPTKICTWRSQI